MYYRAYKYKILFFGLINNPIIYQYYINNILFDYFDNFYIIYLDNIFIYFNNLLKYNKYINKIFVKFDIIKL